VGVELYAVTPAQIREFLHPGKPLAKGWPNIGHEITNAEPMTSTAIRLPLGELLAEYLSREKRSAGIRSQSPTLPAAMRKAAERRLRALETATEQRRPGRPRLYGRDHYEKVAAIYLAALKAGDPPTEKVSLEMRAGKSAATKWVAKARGLGFCPRR